MAMKLRDYGIMLNSPKGRLILRNLADFPDLPLDAHVREADRLLSEAAGRKRYRVYSLKQDRTNREKLQLWRDKR